jgi:hypothetical protein
LMPMVSLWQTIRAKLRLRWASIKHPAGDKKDATPPGNPPKDQKGNLNAQGKTRPTDKGKPQAGPGTDKHISNNAKDTAPATKDQKPNVDAHGKPLPDLKDKAKPGAHGHTINDKKSTTAPPKDQKRKVDADGKPQLAEKDKVTVAGNKHTSSDKNDTTSSRKHQHNADQTLDTGKGKTRRVADRYNSIKIALGVERCDSAYGPPGPPKNLVKDDKAGAKPDDGEPPISSKDIRKAKREERLKERRVNKNIQDSAEVAGGVMEKTPSQIKADKEKESTKRKKHEGWPLWKRTAQDTGSAFHRKR